MTTHVLSSGRHEELPTVAWWTTEGRWSRRAPLAVRGVLSGAFDPLHQGHLSLRRVAESLLGGPVAFELTTKNADKPPLAESEVRRRCQQFAGAPLVITNVATFAQKSLLFPGVTFVVGADTAVRIVSRRFYSGSQAEMHAALETIAGQGCDFLVAARWCGKRLLRLDDVEIPPDSTGLFRAIPVSRFRLDLCSTDLRRLL